MPELSDKLPPSTMEIRPAWRLGDPALERDAIAFWGKLGILPSDASPDIRAKELCCVAYVGGEPAAVSTATIERNPYLKARLAMLRVSVDPGHRRQHLAFEIAKASKDLLERWSHRNQENVHGMGAIIQAMGVDEWKRLPKWPLDLNLVGYSKDGDQFRVTWFDGVRLDEI